MQKITCVDLFSGIGGISLALKHYVQTVLYCEINPFCQQVLSERMSSGDIHKAPVHSDSCNLHLDFSVGPLMLCGGFPCTDISSIGLQKGITHDTQSGLFIQILRLVDSCPSIQILFLENVANISKCGMKEVVDELSKRDFAFCWKMKSASSMGAPHQRMRWFCLAIKRSCPPSIKESLFNCTYNTKCDSKCALNTSNSNSALHNSDSNSNSALHSSDSGSALHNSDSNSNSALNTSLWPPEPPKRITFKPDFHPDPDFDPNWSLRCQTLGNTVVPIVVQQTFLELINLYKNIHTITSCFQDFSFNVSDMQYPYPDSGIVIDSKCFLLPDTKHIKCPVPNVSISLFYNGKTINMDKYPTPRRGITHASTLTDRSIRDLPTILVYCNETKHFIAQNYNNLPLTSPLHTIILPNVHYIEWMMGYPPNWTRIPNPFHSSKAKANNNNNDGTKSNESNETNTSNECLAQDTLPPKRKTLLKYNGMHMFMKEHPGKSVRIIAQMWKSLPEQDRKSYSLKAKQLT